MADDRHQRFLLCAIAAATIATAVIYAIVRPAVERGEMPADPPAIARRLAAHPADWLAASAMSEHALDAAVPDRLALWHAAHDAAVHLAPERDATPMLFARAAFFHWQELGAADRAAAVAGIEPLLRDRPTFFRLARPLFELTGDLSMFRRSHPSDEQSIEYVVNMAAMFGRFDDYRALREELARQRAALFTAKLSRLSPAEIINALPAPPYSDRERPIIVAALEELHRRPLEEDPHRWHVVNALIDYSARHHTAPLDGLEIITKAPNSATDEARFRLALALGDEKAAAEIRTTATTPLASPTETWLGLQPDGTIWECGTIDRTMRGPVTITTESAANDDVPPYVEIYLDDALVAEGEVSPRRAFAVPSTAGMHRIEVRVINPRTRNNTPRRVRVVSVEP